MLTSNLVSVTLQRGYRCDEEGVTGGGCGEEDITGGGCGEEDVSWGGCGGEDVTEVGCGEEGATVRGCDEEIVRHPCSFRHTVISACNQHPRTNYNIL